MSGTIIGHAAASLREDFFAGGWEEAEAQGPGQGLLEWELAMPDPEISTNGPERVTVLDGWRRERDEVAEGHA
eukprot:3854622-Rhodomonas_salina.1